MAASENAPGIVPPFSSATYPDIGWRPPNATVAPGKVYRCHQCGWVGVPTMYKTCGRPGAGSLCGGHYHGKLSIWYGSENKALEDPQWQVKFEEEGRPVSWLPHPHLHGSYHHCYGCYREVAESREGALPTCCVCPWRDSADGLCAGGECACGFCELCGKHRVLWDDDGTGVICDECMDGAAAARRTHANRNPA